MRIEVIKMKDAPPPTRGSRSLKRGLVEDSSEPTMLKEAALKDTQKSLREQLVDLEQEQETLYEKYRRDWDAIERKKEKIEDELFQGRLNVRK